MICSQSRRRTSAPVFTSPSRKHAPTLLVRHSVHNTLTNGARADRKIRSSRTLRNNEESDRTTSLLSKTKKINRRIVVCRMRRVPRRPQHWSPSTRLALILTQSQTGDVYHTRGGGSTNGKEAVRGCVRERANDGDLSFCDVFNWLPPRSSRHTKMEGKSQQLFHKWRHLTHHFVPVAVWWRFNINPKMR